MTEEQQKSLTTFETRVRQLMLLCETLREEKNALLIQLRSRETALLEAEKALREKTASYDNLKLAKMISFRKTDIKEAQQSLSGIVLEIDKCIALINE